MPAVLPAFVHAFAERLRRADEGPELDATMGSSARVSMPVPGPTMLATLARNGLALTLEG